MHAGISMPVRCDVKKFRTENALASAPVLCRSAARDPGDNEARNQIDIECRPSSGSATSSRCPEQKGSLPQGVRGGSEVVVPGRIGPVS